MTANESNFLMVIYIIIMRLIRFRSNRLFKFT